MPDAAIMPDAAETLAALRSRLDGIDDALHDLLMRRADIVAGIAASGVKGRSTLRPGREAQILRRLVARHAGPLPRHAPVRLWRELLAATTAMQGPFAIAVCEAVAGGGHAAAAREHFGVLTPMRIHRSPAQALAEISAGTASVAVLPWPSDDAEGIWWTALLQKDSPRIHVIARLPFWASPRSDGAPRVQACVVAAAAPDPSGDDRTLLGLELEPGASRDRLAATLAATGLRAEPVILRRDLSTQVGHALVELAGFVTEDDARLADLPAPLSRPVVLGAYATPLAL